MRTILLSIATILAITLSIYVIYSIAYLQDDLIESYEPLTYTAEELPYEPEILPENFSTQINNPYFTQPPGREFVYETDSVFDKRKMITNLLDTEELIMGVSTVEYIQEYYLNDQIEKEVKRNIAQDRSGNVWIFGKEVRIYPDDRIKGDMDVLTWTAGEDGAQPGILIKGEQFVGDSYRMEYQQGKHEDIRDVVEIGISIQNNGDTYLDCVRVFDWSPINENERSNSFYCPSTGNLVKLIDLESDVTYEMVDLTAI